MAERTGISASYISEIETGKRPLTDSFAERVAIALGLNVNELVQRLRARYVPTPPRLSSILSEKTRSESAFTSLHEKIMPFGKTEQSMDDFRQLAVRLLKPVPISEAWDLVRTLTNEAQAGDISSAKSAKALIEILSENQES